jgi:hypothetical protein
MSRPSSATAQSTTEKDNLINAMAAFDFKDFLKSVYPDENFAIEDLVGGLVNRTVRARRLSRSNISSDSVTDVPDSLILKHAPPYIAAVGEDAPFSQERQVCLTEVPCLPLIANLTTS